MANIIGRNTGITDFKAKAGMAVIWAATGVTIGILAFLDVRDFAGRSSANLAMELAHPKSEKSPKTSMSMESLSHLFGEKTREPEETVAKAPPTRLDLTLNATFTNRVAESSYALISDKGGNTRSVSTGGEVAPDVILKTVETGHVILSRNGRDETLYLPILGDNSERRKSTTGRPKVSQDVASASTGRNTVTPQSPGNEAPRPSTTQSRSPDQPLSEQAELRRKKLMERLQALRDKK